MKSIYTLITIDEAAKILKLNKRTLQVYMSPSKNRVPKDWYGRDGLGRIRFKKEKLQILK